MSKLSTTMKMVSGSTTYNVAFYTTTAEAGAYGAYGMANVGGTTCYYGLGTGADAAHGSGVKTPLKVIKGSTTYYMLTKGNAELATYTLTLSATTNQTITLKYKNRNATDTGYETEVTKTSTSSAQSFTVRKGTTWTATIAGSTKYNPGSLSASSGTVNAATTVSASNATYKTYTITLTQKANETVTIHYKNHNGTSLATSWSTATKSVTLGHESQYYLTIAASTGYTAGTITSAGSSSSPNTLTAATTISFTAATVNQYYLRYDTGFNVRYNNSSGAKINSGTLINYNQVIWVRCEKSGVVLEDKYLLYKSNTHSGTIWATKTTNPFTFNMPDSQIYIYDRSKYDSGGGN